MTCCILSAGMAVFCWLLPCIPQQRLYFLPLPQGQGAFFEGSCCVWVGMSFRMVGLIDRHCTQDKREHATVPEIELHVIDSVQPAASWLGVSACTAVKPVFAGRGMTYWSKGVGAFFRG